ncbi:sugar ABC transporter permease [Actinoplanes sp. NBRC 101535]|nr:sugar ABC transporter permease [Actinoplanes sp. NBRC 101535]
MANMQTISAAVPPAHRTPPRPRRGNQHRGAIAILLGPFLVLFALFYLIPIGYSVYQSLFTIERVGTFGAPQQVFGGLTQYQQVLANSDFWASIGRVLMFFCVSVPVQLGLALVFALLLDSAVPKGRRFFRLVFFAPYAVPGAIAALMWAFLYVPSLSPFPAIAENVNLLGSGLLMFALANIVNWVYTGYNMLIIYSALQAIPGELTEAARMDGAGQFRIAWSIKIPIVAPALILTGVFAIIGTLQLFNEPTVFRLFSNAVSSDYTPNMMVYATSNVPNYHLAAAYSVVLALATCVLSFAFLKITQKRAMA